MELGKAFVTIEAQNKLAAGLSAAEGQVKKSAEAMSAKFASIGKAMTLAGTVITAAFGVIVKKTMDAGDQFDKMSKRTGITVENLSSLAYACDISGTSIEGLETGIKFLTKGMDDASKGTGLAREAFEELGISVKDTEGNLRPTVDVLKEAATKIAAIEDPTKQAALAMEIFGARSGTQLVPLLKMGGAGIDELMEKAKELGITMSTESAAAAAELKDRLTDLKGSLAGAGRTIGEILIPPLIKLAEKAVEIVKKIKEWADDHKPLIEMIVKVGATLGILAAVGGPILLAVSAFMKMKVAITAISIAIKALAISSGPIGWLILAAGALALAWTTNFGGIRDFTLKVVEKVKEALGWLWDKVSWVLEKLGLYKEKIPEVVTATDEVKASMENAAVSADTFTEANDELIESFEEIPEKAREAGEAIKIYAEDVAGNYIELAIKATESWADFYAFWEAEAERTAKEVTDTIEEVAKKTSNIIKKITNEVGKITGVILPGGGIISTEPIIKPNVGPGYYAGPTPTLQHGTPYVPKTGLYQLHKGEAVTPASQNRYSYDQRQSFSPVISISVAGDADERKIKRVVELALDESARQFRRSGFELVPGRG